jgi:4-oxalmesaconate hydratase
MAHHIGDFDTSATWAAICNELCYRVSQLFPDHFIGAAMLPQSPGVDPAPAFRSWSAASRNTAWSAST